jgi:hypothetical protein
MFDEEVLCRHGTERYGQYGNETVEDCGGRNGVAVVFGDGVCVELFPETACGDLPLEQYPGGVGVQSGYLLFGSGGGLGWEESDEIRAPSFGDVFVEECCLGGGRWWRRWRCISSR